MVADHPFNCTGCPDCRVFWEIDREPIREVKGFPTLNRSLDERQYRDRVENPLPADMLVPHGPRRRRRAPGALALPGMEGM